MPRSRVYPFGAEDRKTKRLKEGFLDERGKIVLSPRYDAISGAGGDFYVASEHNDRVYFDAFGKKLFRRAVSQVVSFGADGIGATVAWDAKGNAYRGAFIGADGKETETEALRVEAPHEGLASATRTDGGPFGYVDLRGRFVIEPKFTVARPFAGGVAAVAIDQKWGVIDRRGKFVCTPAFADAFSAGEGTVAVALGRGEARRWGLVAADGSVLVKPRFRSAPRFSDGLAAARDDRRVGYIQPDGAWAIPPTYEDAGDFIGDVAPFAARVRGLKSLRWGLATRGGEVVLAPKHASIARIRHLFRWTAPYLRTKRFAWGYLSTNGDEIWSGVI